ncbi:MAG TPA: ABC transporter permease [Bryobacteraceae bacterium]|nr:ABC transporter permease [Bryobacteraceae bacterium]
MRDIVQDLRFGLRLFLGKPGFTVLAVLTLALGIAANTTVFSWVDSILLRPFPGAADPGRLAVFRMIRADAPNGGFHVSYLDYRDYRKNLKSLAGLALHDMQVLAVGEPGSAQPVWSELVSGNYFAVLGMKPALGRFFTPEEDGDKPGAYPVVVISEAMWRRQFQEDPQICGKTLRVNQRPLTIVGVAPRGFRGTMPGLALDLFVPLTMAVELHMYDASQLTSRGTHTFMGLARLSPGFDIAGARAEAAAFARTLEKMYPKTNVGISAAVVPLWELPSAGPELLLQPLRILMAIAIILLLIVCANVANLLLARTLARRRELGIRLAMGAGGRRLARQLLTESLLLASAAGGVGILLASWIGGSMMALVPHVNAPLADTYELSRRSLVFTILICAASALLSGLAPALLSLRTSVNDSLKTAGGGGQPGHSHRLRDLLVVAEVALATLTLAGAGLFLRSFRSAMAMDAGFERKDVTLARIHLSGSGMSALEDQAFCRRLRDFLRTAPGVTDATYSNAAPLGTTAGPWRDMEVVEGYMPAKGEQMSVNTNVVAPDYFKTLHIPLLEGRDFTARDEGKAPPVLIVNQAFAAKYWRGANPVGRRIRIQNTWCTVVGMAKNSKYFNIAEGPRPHFYEPVLSGFDPWDVYFMIRSEAPISQVASQLRRGIALADGRVASYDVMPLREWTEVTLLPQKTAAAMAGALGLLSLLLAAVGLYSVMAYAVAQRTREIGIRMALGALPRNVLADVLGHGLALTAAGLTLGIVTALAVTRMVAGLLVGVAPTDPIAFTGTAAFLGAVALLASYVPARRATRIQPMVALRCEQ